MKKTLNVNIGSVAFVIDEDAYYMLNRYLEDVESRVEPGIKKETMDDLEMRIADIFMENISSVREVITGEHVRRAIAIIGGADEFGEPQDAQANGGEERRAGKNPRKLYRSVTDRVIGGVCGGLAAYFNIDVSIIRIIMAVLLFVSIGTWLCVYIILWIIIPSEPEMPNYNNSSYGSNKR